MIIKIFLATWCMIGMGHAHAMDSRAHHRRGNSCVRTLSESRLSVKTKTICSSYEALPPIPASISEFDTPTIPPRPPFYCPKRMSEKES